MHPVPAKLQASPSQSSLLHEAPAYESTALRLQAGGILLFHSSYDSSQIYAAVRSGSGTSAPTLDPTTPSSQVAAKSALHEAHLRVPVLFLLQICEIMTQLSGYVSQIRTFASPTMPINTLALDLPQKKVRKNDSAIAQSKRASRRYPFRDLAAVRSPLLWEPERFRTIVQHCSIQSRKATQTTPSSQGTLPYHMRKLERRHCPELCA